MVDRQRDGHPSATLRDIAAAAGVSTSTAARALSGRGYVSQQAREKVERAAGQLGYVPDALARSLRSRSTQVIGVLITDISNPFYAEVADGIEQVLRSRGYQVLLADSDGGRPDVEAATIRTFRSMRVDGLIVTPAVPVSRAVRQLADSGTVVVKVDRAEVEDHCDAVLVDNELGARAATQHLIELGHRRIGVVLGESRYSSFAGRLEGYRTALREAGLAQDQTLVVEAGLHSVNARRAVDTLLRSHPEVTAIFATNGPMAMAVLRHLRDESCRIPDDISVVAWDEAPWMEIVSPRITTVAQPTKEMGREAARLLVERLAGLAGPPTRHRLPTRLVLRESTAPPRKSPRRQS